MHAHVGRWLGLALLGAAAAGCFGFDATAELPDEPFAVPGGWWEGDVLRWQGERLTGQDVAEFFQQGPPGCGDGDEAHCQEVPLTISIPLGYWARNEGHVRIALAADQTDEDYATFTPDRATPPGMEYLSDHSFWYWAQVLDPMGNPTGRTYVSGFQGVLVELDAPMPGDYTVQVVATAGTAAYNGSVTIVPRAATEALAGAPDLAVLPPERLRIDAPMGREVAPALEALQGCGPDEFSEGARRCLRYATRILNVGPGDFELRLRREDAQAVLAGGQGAWVQRIREADGSDRLVEGPPSHFHPVHGHFHAEGLQKAFIHEYDPASGTIGDVVAEGQKTGLCMVSGGILDINTMHLGIPPERDNGCCYVHAFCAFDLASEEDFVQGIGPGWFDTYPWWRADQYVDIDGLPDGVYAFVSQVNPDLVVEETDYGNNEAMTVFELKGNTVTTLAP